jgi:hypothetical protein
MGSAISLSILGNKARLSHRPIDQFNGEEQHKFGTCLAAPQQKLPIKSL